MCRANVKLAVVPPKHSLSALRHDLLIFFSSCVKFETSTVLIMRSCGWSWNQLDHVLSYVTITPADEYLEE